MVKRTFTRRSNSLVKQHNTRSKGGGYRAFNGFKESNEDVLDEYARQYVIDHLWSAETIREVMKTGDVPLTFNQDKHLVNIIVNKSYSTEVFEALLSAYRSKTSAIQDILENGNDYDVDLESEEVAITISGILDFPDIDIHEAAEYILSWLFEEDEELTDEKNEIFQKIIENPKFDILYWLYAEFDDTKKNVFKKLLDTPSFDFNHVTDGGRTLLMLAAQEGEEELVNLLLLKEGLNINKRNDDGFTAFQLAQNAGFNTIAEAIHAVERKRGARSLAEVATFGKNNNGKKLPELPNNVLRHTTKFLGGTRRRRNRKRYSRRRKYMAKVEW